MHSRSILARITVAAALLAALSACAVGANPVMQTLQRAAKRDGDGAGARLNPNFHYLRVDVDGHVAYLALGNEDPDSRGPIEAWYSAEREVLRLQNGRLVGAVGITTEWRQVVLPELPSWAELAQARQPLRWTRVRDVMPGYRFGVQDALLLRVTPPPAKSGLRDVDPGGLTWFEEEMDTENSTADMALPVARYAVDLRHGKGVVVYGEQCLSRTLCFSWQRWRDAHPGPAGRQ